MSAERYTYYRFTSLTFGAFLTLWPWLPPVHSLLGWIAWGGLLLLLLPVVACAASDRETRRQAPLSDRDEEKRGVPADSPPKTLAVGEGDGVTAPPTTRGATAI